jgi:hypothetical protein
MNERRISRPFADNGMKIAANYSTRLRVASPMANGSVCLAMLLLLEDLCHNFVSGHSTKTLFINYHIFHLGAL